MESKLIISILHIYFKTIFYSFLNVIIDCILDRRLVLQDGKIVNIDTPDIDEVKKTTDRNCDDLIK